jgi:hypothetical protein
LYEFTRRLVKALQVCLSKDNYNQREIQISTMELNNLKSEFENRNIQMKKDNISQNIIKIMILLIEYYSYHKLINEFNEDIVPLMKIAKRFFDEKLDFFDKITISRYMDFYRKIFTVKTLFFKHHQIWTDQIQDIISRIETYFVNYSYFSSNDFIHNDCLKLV